jgi:hypothetical protein
VVDPQAAAVEHIQLLSGTRKEKGFKYSIYITINTLEWHLHALISESFFPSEALDDYDVLQRFLSSNGVFWLAHTHRYVTWGWYGDSLAIMPTGWSPTTIGYRRDTIGRLKLLLQR